jgi:hypothetical protein
MRCVAVMMASCWLQFVSCCVRDEYAAALILCNKVLEFEPHNQTAKEFLPVLQERLKLGVRCSNGVFW